MPLARRLLAVALSVAAVGALARLTNAQDESNKVEAAKATDDPQKALKTIRPLPGFKVELFASEPLLANPVAFHIDEKGRFYVVETFRLHAGVTDTRGHMNWLDDDLACTRIADRLAMYKKFFKPEEYASYGKQHDRIRLIEDRDGDGKAETATVFADGFNHPEDGLGAGVLAHKGNVYFTCIPDLWLLRDTNGDGKADEKTSLHKGYGVHVGFLGHDLHGLIFGPDGKLYFSIGDRGFNVTTFDGKELANTDSGSILRCDPDGTNLEIVATGLRNPQELAFNETGDLFTVDNNSDGGDRARLVQIVEGGDSGWRIGYQFIERPNSRGIWNSEKMWHPAWEGQAAFLVPPLANFTDGPSGLTHDPGTGLNASQRGRFYISDFRGAANTSGIRSFKLKPKGASFEMVEPEQFLWGFEVTDCDFGPDGALYATDWVQGWNMTGKGRIWKVTASETKDDAAVKETKQLLAEGFEDRPVAELIGLLGYVDQRVRQGAQFALVDRVRAIRGLRQAPGTGIGGAIGTAQTEKEVIDGLVNVATKETHLLARLHALWGLGQIAVFTSDRDRPGLMQPIRPLLSDTDPEIRAQAAKALSKTVIWPEADFLPLLKDPSPRVRFFALMALKGIKVSKAIVDPIVALLRTDDGRDPYLRHAAVVALAWAAGLPGEAREAIWSCANDASPNVRMAVLLAMRRRLDPEVARFLDDSEPAIVLEAARCIAENFNMGPAVPKLAALASRSGLSEPLWRRVIWANRGYGPDRGDPRALATIAARNDVPDKIRVEALESLASWAKPANKHPITGLWRPQPERPAEPAVAAFLPVLPTLVSNAPDSVRRAAAKAVTTLKVESAGPTLRGLATDASKPAGSRVEALRALDAMKDAKLEEAVTGLVKDPSPAVRVEAVRILAKSKPDRAIEALKGVLDGGSILEKQGAFATLGAMKDPKAGDLLKAWLDRLTSGEVAPEIRLDLTEAAAKRDELKDGLARYESTRVKDDPLAAYRDALVGGDAERGRRVFREKAEVQCLRCHKVEGDGGEVGPELTGIGSKKDRTYILESIVLPNKQIAQGFETQVIATTDGQVLSGIVKGEDAKEVRLMTAEGKLLTVAKDHIDEKSRGNSAMPEDTIKNLSKAELRDVIEFLFTTKGAAPAAR